MPLSILHLLLSHFPFLMAHGSYIMTSLDHFSEQVLCAQNLSCPLVNYMYPSRLVPLSQVAALSCSKTQLCGYNISSQINTDSFRASQRFRVEVDIQSTLCFYKRENKGHKGVLAQPSSLSTALCCLLLCKWKSTLVYYHRYLLGMIH